MEDLPVRYVVEVYVHGEPGSIRTPLLEYFWTSQPLLGLAAGQIVNPHYWVGATPGKVLRILNVEHLITKLEGHVIDHLMVFTEEVDDTAALRWIPTWRLARHGPAAG
jgi:hypothetical protein